MLTQLSVVQSCSTIRGWSHSELACDSRLLTACSCALRRTQAAMVCPGHCKMQAPGLHSSFRAGSLPLMAPRKAARAQLACTALPAIAEAGKYRLDNLSPQPKSQHRRKRVGRGISAGQGLYCGRGQAGQKSRAGGGTRPGFEGGQTPLYRRVPKLRGIAGGNRKGLPKYVAVNLGDLNDFPESQTVSLESVKAANLIKCNVKDSKLPLKILGRGQLTKPLKFSAEAFSEVARAGIEKAGGSLEEVPKKRKWTRGLGRKRAAAKEALIAEGKKVEGRIPRKMKKGILRKSQKKQDAARK